MAEQQFEYSIAILKDQREILNGVLLRSSNNSLLTKKTKEHIAEINTTILALKRLRAKRVN